MSLFARSISALRHVQLWSGLSAVVLLISPFLPWVRSTMPTEPPGSLLYLTFTFWQDTVDYLLFRDLVVDSLFTLGVGSLWLSALSTLAPLVTRHPRPGLRMVGLVISTGFLSWIASTGATGIAWGYWLCWGALLVSWGTEAGRVLWLRPLDDRRMPH